MEVQNPTNFSVDLLRIGTICNLMDRVDPTEGTMCTVRFIEEDEEMPGLFYYYLIANDEEKNVLYDGRFGKYFTIVEHDNVYLLPMATATDR